MTVINVATKGENTTITMLHTTINQLNASDFLRSSMRSSIIDVVTPFVM